MPQESVGLEQGYWQNRDERREAEVEVADCEKSQAWSQSA